MDGDVAGGGLGDELKGEGLSGAGGATKSIMKRGKTKILVSGEISFDAPMAPGGTATSKFNGEIDVDMESSSAEYK